METKQAARQRRKVKISLLSISPKDILEKLECLPRPQFLVMLLPSHIGGPYTCGCRVNRRASILAEVWWLRRGREEHDEHSDASLNRNKVTRGRMKDPTPQRSCRA